MSKSAYGFPNTCPKHEVVNFWIENTKLARKIVDNNTSYDLAVNQEINKKLKEICDLLDIKR